MEAEAGLGELITKQDYKDFLKGKPTYDLYSLEIDGDFALALFPPVSFLQRLVYFMRGFNLIWTHRDLHHLALESKSYSDFLAFIEDQILGEDDEDDDADDADDDSDDNDDDNKPVLS